MSDVNELGLRIRRQRRKLGMSQTELAGGDLSPSYVSLLEAGKRTPSPDVLRALAARLQCAPEYLLECVAPAAPAELELQLKYAQIALANGEPRSALDAFTAVSAKASDADNTAVRDAADLGVARSLEGLGELERAVVGYEELCGRSSHHSSTVPRLSVIVALCRCYRELGDLSHGVDLAERELAELERLDIPPSVVAVELLSTLVGLYCERGDLNRAGYLASRAVQQAEGLANNKALGAAYWNASMVAHQGGRPGDALAFVRRALALYAEGEDSRALARLRNAYAVVLLGQDAPDVEQAKRLLTQSEQELTLHGSVVDKAYCETAMARADLLLERYDDAVQHAEQALALLGSGHRLQSARTLIVLAAVELRRGRVREAQTIGERVALQLEASEAGHQAGTVWAELADIYEGTGDSQGAIWAYRQSLRCLGHRSTTLLGQQENRSRLTDRH